MASRRRSRQLAPKILPEAAEELETMGASLNAVGTQWLEALPRLYALTLGELRGRFTSETLASLQSLLGGHPVRPRSAGLELLGLASERLGIGDGPALTTLKGLTAFQLAVLEDWLHRATEDEIKGLGKGTR